jgi:hypothetical protein
MVTQQELRDMFDYIDGNLIRKVGGHSRKPDGHHKGEYRVILFNARTYKTHRMIFLYHHGYLPNQIDHIDGNKHNNRIENLRECKPSENSMNIKTRKDSESGLKNVHWESSRRKWRVRIHVNGKVVYSSRFDDLEAAKNAATEARNQYHGEYANHGV